MQKSMTGFGFARMQSEEKLISVEIKTLNSKYFDTNIRLPHLFSHKELEVKQILSKELIRGKVTVVLSYQNRAAGAAQTRINQALAQTYLADIQQTANSLGLSLTPSEQFAQLMAMPEILNRELDEEELEEEWNTIRIELTKAAEACNQFREQEGQAVCAHIQECIGQISQRAAQIREREPGRIQRMRDKLQAQTADIAESEHFSKDRFEQELIYYIEKIDISEEQSRLANHLQFFLQTLEDDQPNGKKLNFIAQEIGREINTLGAKANDADIQKLVIEMKDHLEQIKEQVLNLL